MCDVGAGWCGLVWCGRGMVLLFVVCVCVCCVGVVFVWCWRGVCASVGVGVGAGVCVGVGIGVSRCGFCAGWHELVGVARRVVVWLVPVRVVGVLSWWAAAGSVWLAMAAWCCVVPCGVRPCVC